jgi:NAD/NADP transhydrogenase beta subunit
LDDAKYFHILIHPDAGHTSRRLIEAIVNLDFPDEVLVDDPEQAQSLIDKAELALIIGASDIVNTQVNLTAPYAPFNLDKPRQVIIIKRSLNHGQKKAKNALFTQSHVTFLFGTPQSQLELINTEIEKRDAGLSAWNYIKPSNSDESEFK